MNVNAVYVFLRDSYLRWESIFEGTEEDQGEMGVQVAGGREGGTVRTGVNIASGLSLGPLAFMASQENKSPQETEWGAHEQWGLCFIH